MERVWHEERKKHERKNNKNEYIKQHRLWPVWMEQGNQKWTNIEKVGVRVRVKVRVVDKVIKRAVFLGAQGDLSFFI